MDRKKILIVVAVIIFILDLGVGIINPLFGAGWPEMHKNLGVDMSVGGTVPVFLAIGMLLAVTNSERLLIKIGILKVLKLSVLFLIIAMTGYAFITWFPLIVIMAFFLGLACGLNATITNGFFVRNLESKYMNWLHCIWSVGATSGPLIMAWVISTFGDYRYGFLIAAFLEVAIMITLFCSKSLWHKTGDKYVKKGASAEIKQSIGLLKAMKVPGVPQASLALFFYVSMEMTMSTWSSSYLVVTKDIAEGVAAGWGSLMFVGITISRFLAGFAAKKVGNKGLIFIGQGTALIGILMIILFNDHSILIAGFLVVGLGFGPILPCQIHATKENFGEKNIQAIVNVQAAAQATGFAIFPFSFGRIAGLTGYGIFPYVLLGVLIAYIISVYTLFKIARKTREANATI